MAKKLIKHVHKKTKKSVSKGSTLTCNECGLAVEVVDSCGCDDPCDVVCCGEPMVVVG